MVLMEAHERLKLNNNGINWRLQKYLKYPIFEQIQIKFLTEYVKTQVQLDERSATPRFKVQIHKYIKSQISGQNAVL